MIPTYQRLEERGLLSLGFMLLGARGAKELDVDLATEGLSADLRVVADVDRELAAEAEVLD